jgi:cell division protein FtsB
MNTELDVDTLLNQIAQYAAQNAALAAQITVLNKKLKAFEDAVKPADPPAQ